MPKPIDTAKKVILTQRQKRYLDLNTDYGQTRDQACFLDPENSLLGYVSSVNIPCCVHDGVPNAVMEAIKTARTFNCAVGAHVAYPDPANNGYQSLQISNQDLSAWLLVQVGIFRTLCQAVGATMAHVRPHGALYGKLIDDEATALVLAETLYKLDPWLILVGPSGPVLQAVGQKTGLRIAPEVHLGKRYNGQGFPHPQRFNEPMSPMAILDQTRQLLADSSVTSPDGRIVPLSYSTLHFSPQHDNAPALAEKIALMMGQPVSMATAAVGTSGWILEQ
jgi:5-oxoprolinase (ATP-hydrolysing) subunit A